MGKDLFKVRNRPMDFKVAAAYEKFIDKVSDATLQLTFKELSCVEFYCSIKEYQQLSENAIKILLFYQTYS